MRGTAKKKNAMMQHAPCRGSVLHRTLVVKHWRANNLRSPSPQCAPRRPRPECWPAPLLREPQAPKRVRNRRAGYAAAETCEEQASRVRSSLVEASTSVCARACAATPRRSLTLLVLGVADVAAQVVVAIVEVPQTLRERRLCCPPVCHVLSVWARGARRLGTAGALTRTCPACPGDAGPRCRCPPGRRGTAALRAPLEPRHTPRAGGHRRARELRHTLQAPLHSQRG